MKGFESDVPATSSTVPVSPSPVFPRILAMAEVLWSPKAPRDYLAFHRRVRAKNMGRCPDWHPGAGGPSWLFVDEITVEQIRWTGNGGTD